MPTVHFQLRESGAKSAQPIYLIFRYKKKRLLYGTGFKVSPKYWRKETERVRNVTDEPNRHKINAYLDRLEAAVTRIYTDLHHQGGEVSIDRIREELDIELGKKIRKRAKNLFEFIEWYIEKGGNTVAYRTQQRYQTTLNHLREFEKARKVKVDFDTIDLDFYTEFIDYLTIDVDLAVNTVGVYIKNLKVFLRAAHDEEVYEGRIFEKKWFKVPTEETDHIYLTEEELEKLYRFDISPYPRLERVRDIFVVGCWTGCRFSDLGKIKSKNIEDDLITIKQGKTGERVVIPINRIVREIIDKYDDNLPPPISNQRMNSYLKEVGEKVGLDEIVTRSITKGGIKRTKSFKKYELLSTHVARRSFATNLYKAGFPSETIRKITGHKTETAFLRYLKLTPEEHARKLQKFWQQREPLRKVN